MKNLPWLEKRQQARKKAEAILEQGRHDAKALLEHERHKAEAALEQERQKTEAALEQEGKDAKALLDASSAKNRNILIFFLLFCAYALVPTVSTTDMQLLVPNSSVHLPLLGIGLPLFGYFLIAPILVLIFHLNILLNLHEHLKKLERWLETNGNRDNQTRLLLPFVVDFAFSIRPGEPFRWLFSLMYVSIVYIIPFLVLSTILIRFGDYQSAGMTSIHTLLLMSDLILIGIYRHNIPDTFKRRWSLRHYLVNSVCCFPFVFLPFFYSLLILEVSLAVHPTSETIPSFDFLKSKSLWKTLDSLGQTDQLLSIIDFFPRLTISSNHSIALPDLTQANSYQKSLGNAKSSFDYAPRFDLQGRSLRWANLSGTFIPYVDLSAAKMEEANFSRAQMAGANFIKAQLAGADLTRAQMAGADFTRAQMAGADFSKAHMAGANLLRAQLAGAILLGTQLTEANLRKVQMTGANLILAQLAGADLRRAQMTGASLLRAQMTGANLHRAQLTGASLHRAKLAGANLHRAQLTGAIFLSAQLAGADFSKAHMVGANLGGAQMEATYLKESHLLGITIDGMKNWSGAYVFDPDFKTEPNWEALREKELPTPSEKKEFLEQIEEAQKTADAMKQNNQPRPDLSRYQEIDLWRKALLRVSQNSTFISKGIFRNFYRSEPETAAWLLKKLKKEQHKFYRQLLREEAIEEKHLSDLMRENALSQQEYDAMLKDLQEVGR